MEANNKIVWKHFRLLIESLATEEETYIREEHKLRDKMEKRFEHYDVSSEEKKLDYFQNIPCYSRTIEKHINPYHEHWENRYYTTLFKSHPSPERVRQICINYLQGMEWTFKYYSTDCPDWRWKYNYEYPPLLKDLLRHIPYFDTTFVDVNDHKPVNQCVQLCYVLPKHNLSLLPYKIYSKMLSNHEDYYPEKCEIIWAYCKYFWESHVELPHIPLSRLEQIVESL